MRSVSTRWTRGTKKAVARDSSSHPADYFYKNGRRIQIGDCALFKSPHDFPHLIGIIRCLSSDEEHNLSIYVNKLYRPIELKLDKGILLDAEPNELFYSFHQREISAASLLHPCKVAFLSKGVGLPLGASSFVCRRLFDADNRCLLWLSDQEFFDEQQEEVDQLLYKTHIGMHATIQSGGRSPKPINGPTSMSQLRSGSDNVQSGTPNPSQAKGRKRERVDQGTDPIKRERSSKADDVDSSQFRSESVLKLEVSRITENGGLVDSEGVEKLVQLMQPNRVEKKLELVSKSIFAGVIAATENFDCLSRFVQLKGLPVLDQWLQDIHKGKIGGESPKDGDKSVEEFLFILLRALDKLPVNLQALQMCNIGKSVNHLRTYKNSEIQKKARSLVDTWKKRVEAEMNVIDTKSGLNRAVSWPSRSHLPEGSGGNQQYGGQSEAAIKGSSQSSSAKIASGKPVQAEMSTKLATSSPASAKDGEPRSVVGSNPDLPSTTVRDERSSSSSQSHNSRSCSSDHAKTTGLSGKDDARSSTAGSISVNKVSSGSSRPRRAVTGRPGSAPSESPQETGLSRNSTVHINLASEKLSQSGLTCEKAIDIPTTEGSNHKLIVKIPSRGRSPVQNACVGPAEEATVMHSRSSSPVLSEKNDQSGPNSKEKADVKTESWESNDFKEILTGSDEGDVSPDETKSEKLHDVSLSSINALIESCVKYSQVNTTESGGDDCGMNLLASVAAGEMSKSNLPSPDGSSGRTSNIQDESIKGDNCKSSAPDGYDHVREQYQSEDGLQGAMKEGNPVSAIPEQTKEEETRASFKLVQLDETKDVAAIATSPVSAANRVLVDESKQHEEKAESKVEVSKLKENSLSRDKVDVASHLEVKKEASVGVPSNASLDATVENKADVKESCNNCNYIGHKPSLKAKTDGREGCNVPSKDFLSKSVEKFDGVKLEDKETENRVSKQSIGQGTINALSNECHVDKMTCNGVDEFKKSESSATNAAAETLHVNKKPKFDLNEGFSSDDGKVGDPMNLENSGYPISARMVNTLPFPVASKASGLPAPITVAAAAKGPFVPPLDLLRSKRELGWKGSAATSAFRPAEPRKVLELPPVVVKTPDAGLTKQSRPMLDFDLNVADELIVDDVASRSSPQETASTSGHATIHDFSLKKLLVPPLGFSVGLDLDLNRVDEAGDTWQGSASGGHGMEVPFFPAKASSLGGYPISESKKGFDLNDGPVLDEASEPSLRNPHSRSNMQSQPFFTSQTGTLSSWFPAGNAFPPVTIPSILTERGDQPFPIVATNGQPRALGPPIPLGPELYRGSVLTSSPAVPFPSFQYPVFPFGTGFPLPPASLSGLSTAYTDSLSNGRLGFSASNSQLLSGPPSSVASHFPRPYLVSVPDGSSSMSGGNNSKWARHGLDLNAGPGYVEMEARDESSPLVSGQHSVASALARVDEQGMMFQQMAGGILKRKENTENFRYKQPSWQ